MMSILHNGQNLITGHPKTFRMLAPEGKMMSLQSNFDVWIMATTSPVLVVLDRNKLPTRHVKVLQRPDSIDQECLETLKAR